MSLCDAPYGDAGGFHLEPCDCWEEKLVRVRKRHRCDECGSAIEIDEAAGVAKGVIPGEGWFSMYRCQPCLMLADLVATTTGECPQWGFLDVLSEDAGLPGPADFRQRWEAIP